MPDWLTRQIGGGQHSEIDAKLISLEQKLLGQIQRLESRFDSTDAKIEQLIHTLDINVDWLSGSQLPPRRIGTHRRRFPTQVPARIQGG